MEYVLTSVHKYKWIVAPNIASDVIRPGISDHNFYVRNTSQDLLLESHGRLYKDGRWQAARTIAEGNFYCYHEQHTSYLGTNLWTPSTDVGPVNSGTYLCRDIDLDLNQIFTSDPPEPTPPDFSSYANDQNVDGSHLYRLARPGNPMADLGQFVLELHDLPRLPRILFNRLKYFRELGDEYLNVVFGWKPFVTDLVKMYRTSIRLNTALEQLRRDNNKWIRRSRKLTKDETTDSATFSYDLRDPIQKENWEISLQNLVYGINETSLIRPVSYGLLPTIGPVFPPDYPYPSEFFLNKTIRDKTEVKFTGKFQYSIPDTGDMKWTYRAIAALYGGYAAPSVLWEVLPWSWLIDWFTNVGDIISNASENAVDAQVCQEGVVARHISSQTTTSIWTYLSEYNDPSFGTIIPGGKVEAAHRFETIVKLRTQASPYGFGISYDSLSLYQQLILVALGISRLRF